MGKLGPHFFSHLSDYAHVFQITYKIIMNERTRRREVGNVIVWYYIFTNLMTILFVWNMIDVRLSYEQYTRKEKLTRKNLIG